MIPRFSFDPQEGEKGALRDDDRESTFLARSSFWQQSGASFEILPAWTGNRDLLGGDKLGQLLPLALYSLSDLLDLGNDLSGLLSILQRRELAEYLAQSVFRIITHQGDIVDRYETVRTSRRPTVSFTLRSTLRSGAPCCSSQSSASRSAGWTGSRS